MSSKKGNVNVLKILLAYNADPSARGAAAKAREGRYW